ncbi:hypothetical protein TRVL_08103 [Trypanosoma vivax]|nr:hypothetical protein TRVL_08103 [Trypanosoma vivax]
MCHAVFTLCLARSPPVLSKDTLLPGKPDTRKSHKFPVSRGSGQIGGVRAAPYGSQRWLQNAPRNRAAVGRRLRGGGSEMCRVTVAKNTRSDRQYSNQRVAV